MFSNWRARRRGCRDNKSRSNFKIMCRAQGKIMEHDFILHNTLLFFFFQIKTRRFVYGRTRQSLQSVIEPRDKPILANQTRNKAFIRWLMNNFIFFFLAVTSFPPEKTTTTTTRNKQKTNKKKKHKPNNNKKQNYNICCSQVIYQGIASYEFLPCEYPIRTTPSELPFVRMG